MRNVDYKLIYVNKNIYDCLNELRSKHHCSFGEVISMYVPICQYQLFADIHAKLPPVIRMKSNKSIPKKKRYSYAADLADFEANKCKSLNLSPMKPPVKKRVLKAEYDDKTQAYIDEVEASQPWLKKYRGKKS